MILTLVFFVLGFATKNYVFGTLFGLSLLGWIAVSIFDPKSGDGGGGPDIPGDPGV